MKVWILSSHSTNSAGNLPPSSQIDSTERLLAAAKKAKVQVQVLDCSTLHFEIDAKSSTIYQTLKGQTKKLKLPDLVLPRLGWKSLSYGLRLARFFESAGVVVINSASSLEKASDKLLSLQLFHQAGLKIPTTKFSALNLPSSAHLLKGNKPQVFKLLHGSQGFGVTLHENSVQAQTQADAYRNIPTEFLVQEFIQESAGEDIRAFVIKGTVVAAMKRTAPKGDFRSNLSQGGTAVPVKLTDQEKKLALLACKTLGLTYAGVDLLRSKKGSYLIEANPSPGFEGISETTKIEVAELFFEKIKSLV